MAIFPEITLQIIEQSSWCCAYASREENTPGCFKKCLKKISKKWSMVKLWSNEQLPRKPLLLFALLWAWAKPSITSEEWLYSQTIVHPDLLCLFRWIFSMWIKMYSIVTLGIVAQQCTPAYAARPWIVSDFNATTWRLVESIFFVAKVWLISTSCAPRGCRQHVVRIESKWTASIIASDIGHGHEE